MKEKVLVCITIQENSRRLISEGFHIAKAQEASLHILHVRQGETIFEHSDSSSLLGELFDYGSELGGEVHFLCSSDISQTILDFIIDNHMTHLVLGEAPVVRGNKPAESVFQQLIQDVPGIHISVLSRESYTVQQA